MILYDSIGVLRYDRTPSYGFRLVMEIDPGINLLYKALIPKYKNVTGQRYSPHVSIVRKERPANLKAWGLYEGRKVRFKYSPDVHTDGIYWWLNVYSSQLEAIREELGLPVHSKITEPPGQFKRCFHTTIGNNKASIWVPA